MVPEFRNRGKRKEKIRKYGRIIIRCKGRMDDTPALLLLVDWIDDDGNKKV